MSLEEPTISELIRTMANQLTRIEQAQGSFVTRNEFDAYKELREEKDRVQSEDIAELKESNRSKARMLWTALVAPVIVGVVLFLLQGMTK